MNTEHTEHTQRLDPIQPEPQATPDPEPRDSRPIKVAHLVFAVLFLGLAAVWAAATAGAVDLGGNVEVLLPSLLIAAGVIGLVATLVGGRNRARRP